MNESDPKTWLIVLAGIAVFFLLAVWETTVEWLWWLG